MKLHRSLPTNRLVRIATVTIKHYATGQWTVSLLLKSDEPFHQALPNTNQAVGIDLNTENFLTTSDQKQVANPHYYRALKSTWQNTNGFFLAGQGVPKRASSFVGKQELPAGEAGRCQNPSTDS